MCIQLLLKIDINFLFSLSNNSMFIHPLVVAIGCMLDVALAATAVSLNHSKPNIVYILFDDVGITDLFNPSSSKSIPTPYLDSLMDEGILFTKHYVAPACTPTRASLLTGRYAANVGLTWPVFPGSPSGLPEKIPTMAEVLKASGYATAMSGKWHLGNSQWKQTPVGRGFDVHVGSYSWGIDHFSKQFHQLPFPVAPLVTDWVRSFANGTYEHFVEPTVHSTDAVTDAAISMMRAHQHHHHHHRKDVDVEVEDDADKRTYPSPNASSPLFLYVSYIAAHSPLKPAPHDMEKCVHVDHPWRRQYCGLVVGLDRSVAVLMEQVKELLGQETLVVITSDNGGSSWFGGMNAPYRGEKTTPLQGGVLIPALLMDLSSNQHYITAANHVGDDVCGDAGSNAGADAGADMDDVSVDADAGVSNSMNTADDMPVHSKLESVTDVDFSVVTSAINAHTNGSSAFTSTPTQQLPSSRRRRYEHLMHISDWFPTLLGFAGLIPGPDADAGADVGAGASGFSGLHVLVSQMDGIDLSEAIRQLQTVVSPAPGTKDPLASSGSSGSSADACVSSITAAAPVLANKTATDTMKQQPLLNIRMREEVLLDMFYAGESCFFDHMEAFIWRDLKYIRGVIPDTLWYRETERGYVGGEEKTGAEAGIGLFQRLLFKKQFGIPLLSFNVQQSTMSSQQPSPSWRSHWRQQLLTAYVHFILGTTELVVQAIETLLGEEYGSFDTIKLYLVHSVAVPHVAAVLHELNAHDVYFPQQQHSSNSEGSNSHSGGTGTAVYEGNYHGRVEGTGDYYLFNLTADPYEQHNLRLEDHAAAVAHIEFRLAEIAAQRPLQQQYWMQLSPLDTWPRTFLGAGWGQHCFTSSESYRDRMDSTVSNDNSSSSAKDIRTSDGSGFIHPWYSDLVPESELTTHDDLLVSSIEEANKRMQALGIKLRIMVITVAIILLTILLYQRK